jgi:hypothetical protein
MTLYMNGEFTVKTLHVLSSIRETITLSSLIASKIIEKLFEAVFIKMPRDYLVYSADRGTTADAKQGGLLWEEVSDSGKNSMCAEWRPGFGDIDPCRDVVEISLSGIRMHLSEVRIPVRDVQERAIGKCDPRADGRHKSDVRFFTGGGDGDLVCTRVARKVVSHLAEPVVGHPYTTAHVGLETAEVDASQHSDIKEEIGHPTERIRACRHRLFARYASEIGLTAVLHVRTVGKGELGPEPGEDLFADCCFH